MRVPCAARATAASIGERSSRDATSGALGTSRPRASDRGRRRAPAAGYGGGALLSPARVPARTPEAWRRRARPRPAAGRTSGTRSAARGGVVTGLLGGIGRHVARQSTRGRPGAGPDSRASRRIDVRREPAVELVVDVAAHRGRESTTSCRAPSIETTVTCRPTAGAHRRICSTSSTMSCRARPRPSPWATAGARGQHQDRAAARRGRGAARRGRRGSRAATRRRPGTTRAASSRGRSPTRPRGRGAGCARRSR